MVASATRCVCRLLRGPGSRSLPSRSASFPRRSPCCARASTACPTSRARSRARRRSSCAVARRRTWRGCARRRRSRRGIRTPTTRPWPAPCASCATSCATRPACCSGCPAADGGETARGARWRRHDGDRAGDGPDGGAARPAGARAAVRRRRAHPARGDGRARRRDPAAGRGRRHPPRGGGGAARRRPARRRARRPGLVARRVVPGRGAARALDERAVLARADRLQRARARDAGADRAMAQAGAARRAPGRLRGDRGACRLRSVGHRDDRAADGRRLRDRRREVVRDVRRRGERLHRHGERRLGGRARSDPLPRPARDARHRDRRRPAVHAPLPPRPSDGPLHRRRGPVRRRHRRGRRRRRPPARVVHRGAPRHRRARVRRDVAAARGGGRVGNGARAGRGADLRPPGRVVPARRQRRRRRRRPGPDARRLRARRRPGRRPEARPRQGVDVQAVRLRACVGLRRPGRPDVRRARLPAHERRRALPARAARRPHLGGHERDPAADRGGVDGAPQRRAPVAPAMDLTRLMSPRSIAVVGATPREDTYAHETLRNLALLGYDGEVWGVHPTHRSVLGREVFASVSALPAPADAVVVAVPAAGVPDVVEEAGAAGCGGAVVFGAGFADAGDAGLQQRLVAAAERHDLPVIGPNCDGMVRLHERAALWGDALRVQEPGGVALVSQSGNLAVNALATRRGLRLHTVVSCGNQAVLDAGDVLAFLAEDDGVRSIALYLEDDGDAVRLCEALARCCERGVGVAVLKAGASAVGASAAATHTGAIAGDHRVFRALVDEAGAAWARDGHELLELAKALACGRRARGAGVALVTCSGADCAVGADEAERLGVSLPALGDETVARLRALLPSAAPFATPLNYPALIGGEPETLRDTIAAVGGDEAIDQVLVLYDQPAGVDGWSAQSWANVREGIVQGAADSPAPVPVAATLPELLDDASAADFAARGIPAACGLREGLLCARALQPAAAPDLAAARLRAIGRAAAAGPARAGCAPAGRWLAEHEAKALLRTAGVEVVPGRVALDEDDAGAAAGEVGCPVALKRSVAGLRHKTEAGALALGVADEGTLRREYRRLATGGAVLVEAMAAGTVELLVAARRDPVVPALVIGGRGPWAALLDDAVVVPLPARAERIVDAIRALRGAPLLCGGRGRPALAVEAAARLAAAAGDALLAHGLELVELNPVLVSGRGALALDAVVREGAR